MVYNDWSDDDTMTTKGRDKFRHERSYDDYDRRKRSRRSPTPPEGRTCRPFLSLLFISFSILFFFSFFIIINYSFFTE
jgi:hypothetical protein